MPEPFRVLSLGAGVDSTTLLLFRGQRYQVGGGVCEPEPLPDWLPTVLPAGWDELPVNPSVGRDYARVYAKHGRLVVIISCARYGDGQRWLHVSVSRKNREIPTWSIMDEIKDLFIGPERTAYQVHPPRAKHVSLHEGVLHLW